MIAAMDRTVKADAPPSNVSIFRRLAIPLAAAAGIALAFSIIKPARPTSVARIYQVPIQAVQAGFVRTFESASFDLEKKGEDHRMLIRHLAERNLPSPTCMPPGFDNVKGVGCRELLIDGKRGSLICFMTGENGLVHMVIFRREDVAGNFPEKEQPDFAQNGKWATARWGDRGNVYLVLCGTDVSKLTAMF